MNDIGHYCVYSLCSICMKKSDNALFHFRNTGIILGKSVALRFLSSRNEQKTLKVDEKESTVDKK